MLLEARTPPVALGYGKEEEKVIEKLLKYKSKFRNTFN